MRRLARPLLVLVALSFAVACSDDDSTITAPDQTDTTASSGGTEGTTITVKDFSFSPPTCAPRPATRSWSATPTAWSTP